MKSHLIAIVAAVLVVGCGESQQSAPSPETQPAEPVAEVPAQPSPTPVEAKPVKPVAEAAKPEPPTAIPVVSIHDAAKKGNLEAVKKHLADGADVNAKDDKFGTTPLYKAAYYGHKEIVVLLIAAETDVNPKNVLGTTPLHSAAAWGHKEIAELLIGAGADVNAIDVFSKTPLDAAIRRKHPEIADLLRKHGGKTGEELKAEGK